MRRSTVLYSGRRRTYSQKILSLIPGIYAIYPLNETTGLTAEETVNNYDATYSGPTLNQIAGPGASMGNAALYDGVNDYCQLPAASLDGPFDPNLGTLLIWMKVTNAGVWTDGAPRYLIVLGVNANNRILVWKPATANRLELYYFANGAARSSAITTSSIEWLCLGITWNNASNRIRFYLNGIQQGSDATFPGVWGGALANAYSLIGSQNGASFWRGYPSLLALSNQEATAAQMAAAAIAA